MRKIHYFEDGGPSDGGADNTSSAFNNNNTNDNTNNAPADNTPATPPSVVGHEYTGPDLNLNVGTGPLPGVVGHEYTGPDLNLNVGTGPLAAAPLGTPPSGEDRGAFVPTSPLSIAQTAYNDAKQALTDKIATQTGLPSYAVQLTPEQNAGLLAQYSTTMADKWTQPATKNNEAVDRNDLKFDISPAQLMGETPDRATLKALSAMGLGGVYGVGGINPQQNADNIVAAQNVNAAINVALDIAKNFIPGYGMISFAANLLSGKITPGQAVVGIASDRVASLLGIPSSLFRAAIGGDYGNGIAGWATSALNSYVAKETKTDPRLTALVFNSTGLPSLAKTSLSSLNVGPNFAGAAAGGIDSGLSSIGIGSGPATTTGNVPNLGTDAQSQAENILNPGSIAPTTAPLSLSPTSSTAPATGNISSADTSRGLTMPSLMSPSSGLAYVGDRGGSKYTPYSQNLSQLSLSPTQDLAMNYGPISNATAAQDIAKMSALPFESTMYASGGPVRHFDGGSLADSTSTETQTPGRTPQQQAAYEAMQQNLQYYKDLGEQKQNDKIMSGLRALAGVGALEATPERAPAREPLMRLGQAGTYTPPKVLPQLAALLQARGMHLAEGGQPDDHQHPNYDGTPVFRTGGLNGLGGKYVEGKGDGTSDDITAMLANGEYVFSADVVSALGNGSNKAGAKELDQMVQAIRSRARSAPPDKLPPDAKSPLEYLKSKGKNHGTN